MVSWRLCLIAAAAFWSGAARPEDRVLVAPAPQWTVAVPPPPERPVEGALDFRLVDVQVRVDERGLHQFFHQILRVLTPEGLTLAGNVSVAWQPGIGSARVNRVVVHRDGRAIDILGDGSRFQVLRRESNLENMELDGVLTAVMPVPDLRVGDEIEVAWTLDLANPVLSGRSEARFPLAKGVNMGRMFIRYSWPKGRKIASAIGSSLPAPAQLDDAGLSGFVISRLNYEPPAIPEGAPSRFAENNAIAISEFTDWAAVAAAMRPLYVEAARVTPGSPLDAEIRRIAALSADPVARADEALRVVQGQVRYFARIDGLGGYRPDSAEAVWAARSGDCKGKTALLLAILRGLGIEAQAAMVSTTEGDGLDHALPMPARFNHVIARVTINGQVYWLDGARLGDRTVRTLPVPAFKWALPVDGPSDRLEALAATPQTLPVEEWRLDLDARRGLDAAAGASATGIFRGDQASTLRTALSIMPAGPRDEFLRKMWHDRHDWITPDHVTYSYDEASGEVRLGMTGTGTMDWNRSDGPAGNRYEANKARLGQTLTPERPDSRQHRVPVAVAPVFTAVRQTILLPQGGRGFRIQGEPIDRTIGGISYHRTATLSGERFDMEAITRGSGGEIAYDDAVAADEQMNEIFNRQLFILMPPESGSTRGAGKEKEHAVMIAGSIADEDYPVEALRTGAQGIVVASFDIDTDGRVAACRIAVSSGSTVLDDRTCQIIRERFLYTPAHGRDGKSIPETRSQRVVWRSPGDADLPTLQDITSEISFDIAADGTTSNCKGSRTPPTDPPIVPNCSSFVGPGLARDVSRHPIDAHVVVRQTMTVRPIASSPSAPARPVAAPAASGTAN